MNKLSNNFISLIDKYDKKILNILASASSKCPRFCKCLRSSKSGFATFPKFDVHQKLPELLAVD